MKFDSYIDELIDVMRGIEITCSGSEMNYADGVEALVDGFTEKKKNGFKVFFVGNGGSAAIASHMTADFMKNGGLVTCSLYDTAVTTCMGNDYGYQDIFSRPLEFLASKGDLLVAISSSGKSPNIINAINAAKKKNADVYTLTGFSSDNPIRGMGDINVYVPIEKYGIVESIHNMILQEKK